MSEEPPSEYEAADLDERRMYHVMISGEGIAIPINALVELPAHLTELFIEASKEATPTAGQQVLQQQLTAHLNELFPGIAEDGFTSDNVTIESVSDEE